MFAKPRPTIESLKATIARLEAMGKSAATWRVKLKDLRNAQLVAELKASRLRARRAEIAA